LPAAVRGPPCGKKGGPPPPVLFVYLIYFIQKIVILVENSVNNYEKPMKTCF